MTMARYWRNPDATAAAIQDGWLRTGDLGRIDGEGYLYHPRPQERHDRHRRRECLSARGRGHSAAGCGYSGGRRVRSAGRPLGAEGGGRGGAAQRARSIRRRCWRARSKSSPATNARSRFSSPTACRRMRPARCCERCCAKPIATATRSTEQQHKGENSMSTNKVIVTIAPTGGMARQGAKSESSDPAAGNRRRRLSLLQCRREPRRRACAPARRSGHLQSGHLPQDQRPDPREMRHHHQQFHRRRHQRRHGARRGRTAIRRSSSRSASRAWRRAPRCARSTRPPSSRPMRAAKS